MGSLLAVVGLFASIGAASNPVNKITSGRIPAMQLEKSQQDYTVQIDLGGIHWLKFLFLVKELGLQRQNDQKKLKFKFGQKKQ